MNIYDFDPELENAKKRAFRILERMPRTEKQIREKLQNDQKYSVSVIELVIEYLKEYHYLDDRQYSVDYINSRKNNKGLKVLLYELRNKGVSDTVLEEMKEEFSDIETDAVIKRLISKKGIDPNSEDRKQKEKLYRFLLSRGFSYSDISNVISDLKEEY